MCLAITEISKERWARKEREVKRKTAVDKLGHSSSNRNNTLGSKVQPAAFGWQEQGGRIQGALILFFLDDVILFRKVCPALGLGLHGAAASVLNYESTGLGLNPSPVTYS